MEYLGLGAHLASMQDKCCLHSFLVALETCLDYEEGSHMIASELLDSFEQMTEYVSSHVY